MMQQRALLSVTFSAVIFLAGCTVGPKYRRPVVDVPATFRGASAGNGSQASSLGDEKWWAVFHDQELNKLIHTALQQNYNVQIAATRILQAEAQLGVTRSQEFPTLGIGASVLGARQPAIGGVLPAYHYIAKTIEASASWNVDFWGRYRKATEAARANLVATEWGRRAVLSTIVDNVAAAYFQLRELDLELEISKNTLNSRQQSLKLTQTLESGGATSMLDVRQAQQLVETAAEQIPDIERAIQQQENYLSILLAENPAPVARGLRLTEEPLPASIPAGLPSRLLERRPDIQQAEQQLKAANAQIGVAKAAFFPQIPLTASAGLESLGLANLFTGSARIWNFNSQINQPIFTGGNLTSNLKLAEAQHQQAVLTYKQTIQQAFREVSDSLVAFDKSRQFREHQQLLTNYAKEADDLSHMRYRGGATSYLEVLTSETNYFSAEIGLARAQLNERLSLVQVYNALGGGWEQ